MKGELLLAEWHERRRRHTTVSQRTLETQESETKDTATLLKFTWVVAFRRVMILVRRNGRVWPRPKLPKRISVNKP